MQMSIHRADDRGSADHGWLQARHSFSFAGYYRPDRMNFGMLRVLNDDVIGPGRGFGTHPHDNMEIVTIPLEGALTHRDSIGNVHELRSGEVQAMSAGGGITHSEFNASDRDSVSLLQIWVSPKERNVEPVYDQKFFEIANGTFTCLVSPDGGDGSLPVNQDAYFFRGRFKAGTSQSYVMQSPANGVYLFVIDGSIEIADETLERRDAIGVWETSSIEFTASTAADVLFIEVPM
ncbi:MAG: pirin family protein [Bacteroidetes bacterium]|nr:pirin family protein [Bacteroidota bacterium]